MATSNSSGINGGYLGEVTFYQRNGRTIARPRHNMAKGDNQRTIGKMSQRTKMGNVGNVWKSFRGQLKETFEKAKPNSSDYTGWMAANLGSAKVYLTKDEAAIGYAIAGPYVVSAGSLRPNIEVRRKGEHWLSDIRVGDGFDITPETTVGMLSAAIVAENGGDFLYGDTLTFVRMEQTGGDGKPLLTECLVQPIRLERSRLTLHQLIRDERAYQGLQVVEGRLAAPWEFDCLIAWIRTRRTRDGRLQATTQQLVGDCFWYKEYGKWEQREMAMLSYGPIDDMSPRPDPGDVPSYEREVYRNYLIDNKNYDPTPFAPDIKVTLRAMPEVGGIIGYEGNNINTSFSSNTPFPVRPYTLLRVWASDKPGWRFKCWDDGDTDPDRELRPSESGEYIAFFEPIG